MDLLNAYPNVVRRVTNRHLNGGAEQQSGTRPGQSTYHNVQSTKHCPWEGAALGQLLWSLTCQKGSAPPRKTDHRSNQINHLFSRPDPTFIKLSLPCRSRPKADFENLSKVPAARPAPPLMISWSRTSHCRTVAAIQRSYEFRIRLGQPQGDVGSAILLPHCEDAEAEPLLRGSLEDRVAGQLSFPALSSAVTVVKPIQTWVIVRRSLLT